MIWPFSSKHKGHLGIDIGTTSIKIVQINKRDAKLTKDARPIHGELVNYAMLTSYSYIHRKPTTLVQGEGVAVLESEVIAMLQQLLAQFNDHPREVVMSIPAFSSFVDEVTLPPMPAEELPTAIAFEARSHVPVPITEVELTWQITGQSGKGSTATIIAVPKEIIFRYRTICAQLGLSLKALEVETFSIVRALNLMTEEPLVVVDIGSRNTSVFLVANKLLRASHNIDTAGQDITNAIRQGLGVAPLKAEQIKRDQGLMLASQNKSLEEVIFPPVDNIIEEVKRMIAAKNMAGIVKKLVVTGGSSNLKGLQQYMVKRLNFSIDIANPWATIEYSPRLTAALQTNAPSFTVAIGLGLY